MKNILKITVFLMLALYIFQYDFYAVNAFAQESESIYYVDKNHPKALDNSSNGSIEQPWKTLEYAFQQLNPGDTLLIREGTYRNAAMTLTDANSGSKNQPITVKAYPNEKVVLKKGGSIDFKGASWWILENLIFEGFEEKYTLKLGRDGYPAKHITIRQFTFRDTKAEGIALAYAEDILIENSRFLRINTEIEANSSMGIDVLHQVKGVVIRNNKFIDIAEDGIHMGATSSPIIKDIIIEKNEFLMSSDQFGWGENGIDIKTVQGPVVIKGNHFQGFRPVYRDGIGYKGGANGVGLVLHMGSQNVHIEGNIFEDNTINVSIADQQHKGYRPTKNITVVNNVIKDARYYKGNKYRPAGIGIGLYLNGVKDNIQVFHNTFANNNYNLLTSGSGVDAEFRNNVTDSGKVSGDDDDNFVASHNAWSNISGRLPSMLTSNNDIVSEDLRIDSTLRPLSESSLLDNGKDVGITDDFDGTSRSDGMPDLGAFENGPDEQLPSGPYLSVNPIQTEVYPGDAVQVNLAVNNVKDLYGLQVDCEADPTMLTLQDAQFGDFFTDPLVGAKNIDAATGKWLGALSQKNPAPALSGNGTFATLTFQVLASGEAAISCNPLASDRDGFEQEMAASGDIITVLDVIPEEAGMIAGTLTYQGRADHAGVNITAVGLVDRSVETTDTGHFEIDKLEGDEYIIKADANLYLPSCTTSMVTQGQTTELAAAALVGGDTDDNDEIRINDATLIGSNFGLDSSSSPAMNSKADINADGQVNVQDLSLLGGNFGKQGCQEWTVNSGT